MRTETIMRLIPEMCALAADPEIRTAAALAAKGCAEAEERLCRAVGRHPEARETAAIMTAGTEMGDHRRRFDEEALALLHLCGQCGAGELMAAAARCASAITPSGLALLVSEGRRQEAMLRYGLQLLWRMCGEGAIPDAMETFPEQGPVRQAEDVISDLVTKLKGGGSDA